MLDLAGLKIRTKLVHQSCLADSGRAFDERQPASPALGGDAVVAFDQRVDFGEFELDREIATHADFFSFGTNDLTQTGIGFSRDDIEGKILARYIDRKVLERSPFETLDIPGVGQLVRMGAWLGRKTRADLKIGICGEHGGDPASIAFCESVALDYVSCSPFRVPIARLAAAQAALDTAG